MIDNIRPLFSLGQIVATPAALEAIQEAGEEAKQLIERHIRGDWGDLDSEDAELNNEAVKDGSRILSAYILTNGTKVWVITEAEGDDGKRSATTLLLPEEY